MGFIYIIKCTKNDRVYIGQTTNSIRMRWNAHKSSAIYNKKYLEGVADAPRSKRGMCSKLYRAMNCHGIENFYIEVLEEADDDLLDALEKQYIEEFNSISDGYNLKTGGDRSNHSKETIELLKIKNSNNMKRTYIKFRKHKEIDGLPMYCIYINKPQTYGVAINKHPLCNHKQFTVRKYGNIECAKQALLDYLVWLELYGIPKTSKTKRDPTLPRGVNKIKNSYFVDKTIKGITYRKSFSGLSNEENKNNAITYLNSLK